MKKVCVLLIAFALGLNTLNAQDFVPKADSIKDINEHQTPNAQLLNTHDFPPVRLAVLGGWSWQTAKTPGGVPGYNEDLNSGKNLGLQVQYYFLKPIGLGVRYAKFHSRTNSQIGAITYEADLSNKFIGPTLSGRYLHFNDKNALYFNLGYGYVDYKFTQTPGVDLTIKGNSTATIYDLGYELGFTQKFAIIFQATYLIGNLKKYDATVAGEKVTVYLPKGQYKSLDRFDFSAGLRFNL